MTIRTVRRLVSDEETCRQLAQVPNPKSGGPIFRTFRELSVFAATVGYEQQRRVKLSGPTDVFVDGRIMESSEAVMDMVYLLGLAAERRQEILSDDPIEQEKLVEVYEEFAAGGLDVIREWLAEDPADPDGDRAIRGALSRHGYLEDKRSAADALGEVDF